MGIGDRVSEEARGWALNKTGSNGMRVILGKGRKENDDRRV